MLFTVAAVAISISAGAWWMQRIVFTPDATRDTAAAILQEPDIRLEINSLVSSATSPFVGKPVPELGTFLETDVLSTRAGALMMAPLIEQAHDRIIGNTDEQLQITGLQMIDIVRDQRAADVGTVTWPLETIGTLSTIRRALGWIIPISGALGLILLLLGIFARPERREVIRGLGEFCVSLAMSMLFFGYFLPVQLIPAIDNRTWTNAIPRLAMRTWPVVLGSTAVFAALGAVLIIASMTGGKRRQWSTPLAAARYRGGQNPGWG
jgi:hypothetical protein